MTTGNHCPAELDSDIHFSSVISKHRLTVSCPSPQVQVWDTAGQERFRKSMVEHYYRNVHAVVFVYDVTKMASFRNLQTWIEVGLSAKYLNSICQCRKGRGSTLS